MKTILAAFNAKFAHTNLAIRSLKRFALDFSRAPGDIVLKEFTINMTTDDIRAGLYDPEAAIYGLSAYIWNIGMVLEAAAALKTLNPRAAVLLGGPEASYGTRELMCGHPYIDYCIAGEGEAAFAAFLEYMAGSRARCDVPSLFYRDGDVRANPPAPALDLDRLPFAYGQGESLAHRVVYYESSRGCPFSCTFCLSSAVEGVRYRSLELVKKDLCAFASGGAMKVKFVDRTFNADRERAKEILRHIAGLNGDTGFHFEIYAELLDGETVDLFARFPRGRVQVEAGVQSVHPPALKAVNRRGSFDKLADNMKKLVAAGNVHTHVDLIAGLPYEGYADFRRSFDCAFSLRADHLQLGFLKLLKGCRLREEAGRYGIAYLPYAPYTVLRTGHLSFEELNRLRRIGALLDRLYNSASFRQTVLYLAHRKNSAFALFEELADAVGERFPEGRAGEADLARLLYDAGRRLADDRVVANLMRFDYCMRKGKPALPGFLQDARSDAAQKWFFREGYKRAGEGKPARQDFRVAVFDMDMRALTRTGEAVMDENALLFDYRRKHGVSYVPVFINKL